MAWLTVVSIYVLAVAATVKVVDPTVKAVLVALWMVKPVRVVELSSQLSVTCAGAGVDPEPVAVRFVGAAGGVAEGVTLFEAADAAPVPAALVAVTVKV